MLIVCVKLLLIFFFWKWFSMFFQYLIFTDAVLCQKCSSYVAQFEMALINHCYSCSYMKRPDGDYRFVCLVCDYHTQLSNRMRRHLSIHTGEKPYKCNYCTYESTNSSHLNRHKKIRHHESCWNLKFNNVTLLLTKIN